MEKTSEKSKYWCMRKLLALVVTLGALTVGNAVIAQPAAEKPAKKERPVLTDEQKKLRADLLAKYDTNKDGKLDKDELAKVSEEDKAKLKEAQLSWIKYREASCIFESSGVEGGSAHTMIYLNCMATITLERVKSLKALATCKEGDLSCPSPE